MFSVRRCAVTVISSSAPVPASVPPVAGSAAYAAQDEPPRMAATAYEIFEFIADPLDSMCTTAAPALAAFRAEGASAPLRLLENPCPRGIAVDGTLRLQAPRRRRQAVSVLELAGKEGAVREARLVGGVGGRAVGVLG